MYNYTHVAMYRLSTYVNCETYGQSSSGELWKIIFTGENLGENSKFSVFPNICSLDNLYYAIFYTADW